MATQQATRAAAWDETQAPPAGPARPAGATREQSDLRRWVGLAVLGLVAFAILTAMVAAGVTFPFDQPLIDATNVLGQYMVAWQDVSASANLPLIVIGVGVVIWLVWKRHGHEALLVIAILVVVTAGSELVKQLIARPRPPGFVNGELGVVYSYPSGHVLEAITIYGIIAVLVWRSTLSRPVRLIIPILFIVNIALVAVARVAVGAHYPSDVLGGTLAGIGFLALFVVGTVLFYRRDASKSRDDPAGPRPVA
ncbi:MAG: phosphatase PAP2 family protein [Chloroflexota bacterium]